MNIPSGDIGYLKMIQGTKEIKEETIDQKKLKEQCKDFESIFIKMMLDSMDKTLDHKNNPFHGGQGEEIFKGMLNQERAKSIAQTQSIGIAEMMYKQLSKGLIK